jgi:uncharacterized DUF497 family protein
MRKVFVWRPRNIEHIAKHGVSPQEAKYVVEHASRRYPQRIGEGRYIVRGRTAGGRAIQVIFLVLSDDAVMWSYSTSWSACCSKRGTKCCTSFTHGT